jgi:hypothetical protein
MEESDDMNAADVYICTQLLDCSVRCFAGLFFTSGVQKNPEIDEEGL